MAGDRGSSPAWAWWDAYRAHRQGPEAIRNRQKARLAELVAYARSIRVITGTDTGSCPGISRASLRCR